jgi:hypothetical protein
MQTRWFWKNWTTDFRAIGYGLAVLFVAGFFLLWISYFQGSSSVIQWETFQHQVTRETVSHSFELGNFEFSIPIESYLTFEYFNGGSVHPNTTASYLFLFTLVACALVLLSVINMLDRFWFIAGMGLFILFLVSLRLEVLRLFSFQGRPIPIAVITIYFLISLYFNFFRSSTRFVFRLLVFTLVTVFLGVIIHFFSAVQFPFLHLATTGYLPGLVLSVIFILMIAHEIMASFIYVTSSGTSSSKSLQHFMIITAIYLGNLVLAYMHEAGIIQWNFIYINLYLLLSVSAILGIWGFKHRENLYESIVPFNPYGAYLIVSLGCITLMTTGMLLGNYNDAALKIIRDTIIFSHLGYSFIFFIYVVSNFMIMMADNLPAWKVLYKPVRMPYFTFRFAGLIATLAFVFYSNWREYVYHGMSGFYNHLGDLYELMDKPVLSEAYYQQARSYSSQNNRTNYILGLIESNNNDFKKAHFSYELANKNRPSEYSYANEGNLYMIEGKYFEGIGLFHKFFLNYPNSGALQNNLGYAYARIHKLDSSLIYFNQARQHNPSKPVAEGNFLAVIGNEYLPVKADSLLHLFKAQQPITFSNALAVATLQNQGFNYETNPLQYTKLDFGSAALLNNYLVHKLKNLDTTTINAAYRIASDSVNIDFNESLKATLAQAYYHQNHVSKAFSVMSELAFLSQIMQGKFNYIAGLWSLEQGSPELAISYFDYAVMFDYKEARLYNAIALAEASYLENALRESDSLLNHRDENIREIGRQLKKVLTVPASSVNTLNDLEKYQYCRYRITSVDTVEFNRIINSIGNNDYKVRALLEMSQLQFDLMNMPAAIRYLNQTGGIPITDKSLFEKVRQFELILLASRGELRTLANQINEGIEFSKEYELEKFLFQALLQESNGDTVSAEKNYTVLAEYNPFFEEGVIAAARYYKKLAASDMRAYQILAEAIQVNTTSYRLWQAYINEALSVGFDRQAEDAMEQAAELKRRK